MKKPWCSVVLAAFLSMTSWEAFANDDVAKLASDPANWVMQSGDFGNQRYSALKQINKKNVKDLSVAWSFSTGVLRGHEGGPLVVGDTLYVHTPYPNKVFAVSLEDQSIKWKYEPKQDARVVPVMCCDLVAKGVAYAEGKIFLQQADMTLVALDADTGREVWKTKTGDPLVGASSTNAPHVFKDKIITGMAGGEFGVRGWIAAYDIHTGKQVWRGYSMGPDEDMLVDPAATMTWTNGKMAPVGSDSSLRSWQADQWKIGGGATWGWYSFDPGLNLLYYGSGNPSTWNPKQRPGDNKYSMTIWARDVDTGKVKWLYQMTPHDEWDYDGINEMILADIKVKGRAHKALVHFDRNGFAYTLDRASGELLTAEKFDPTVNWASHVDMKTGRPAVVAKYSTELNGEDVTTKGVCPTAQGSKNFVPAAYNPTNHLFYAPTNHMCMTYEPFRVEYTAGQPYVGATLTMGPTPDGKGMGNFIVWDADKGRIVQSKNEPYSVWSGVLVTAGGVACYGTLEGYLKCVDADDVTKELFRFKTPSGIIGNVNTWEYKGRQYIGVLSGIGGWAGVGLADPSLKKETDGLGAVGAYKSLSKFTEQGGVLTVFAVPERSMKTAQR
jgi:lanthanide-dependent methanol dehydrogenase